MYNTIVDTVYAQLKILISDHVQSSLPISVLLALSGGADSMGLLRVLHIIQEQYHFCKVHAVHVEHNMQNTHEQMHENTVVQHICSRYNIPLFCTQIAPGTIQHEHEARQQRYTHILHVAYMQNICIIITAHHQDDQYETILMRMMRGDGARGLTGIPSVRKYIQHSNDANSERRAYYIIRPALQCKGSELKHVALQTGCDIHHDRSNDSNVPIRNRIRNTITPELQKIFPDITKRIASIAAHQRTLLRDLGVLDTLQASINTEKSIAPWFISDDGLCISKSSFEQYSYTMRLHILFMAANRLGLSRISEKFFAPLLKKFVSTNIRLYKSNTVITVDDKTMMWQQQSPKDDTEALFLLPAQVEYKNMIHNKNRFDIQNNSYYIKDSSITAQEVHTILYDEGTWRYYVHSEEHNDEYTHGLRHTCEYVGSLAWHTITKHDSICMGNVRVNVKSALDSPKWKLVPVLKDTFGIVMVPGEVFAGRTLCASRKHTFKEHRKTLCTCTAIVGYRWVTILHDTIQGGD